MENRVLESDVFAMHNFVKNDVTVVIPTLNEQESIGYVIRDLKYCNYNNIIVVDGHSADLTLDIVKNYDVLIMMQKGIGKAGALKTAFKNIKTPYVVVIDGDCTYAAGDIEKLFELSNKYDMVIGNRIKNSSNMKFLNIFGNWFISKVFCLLFMTNIHDVCSGLYLLNTNFAQNIDLKTKGFDVEVELAAHAAVNHRVGEIPINFRKRVGIQKLHAFRDGIKIIFAIFRMRVRLFKI